MTSTQIKDNINADITSKTAPNSISRSDVSTNLVDIVDYVDQEVVSKTIKVTISHDELLALNTTPKEILPAVSNKAYLPSHICLKYINNSGWGTSGSPWLVKINGATLSSLSIQIGGGSVKEELRLASTGNTTTTDTFFNQALVLQSTANLASPSDNTTTVDVYLTYFEVTI